MREKALGPPRRAWSSRGRSHGDSLSGRLKPGLQIWLALLTAALCLSSKLTAEPGTSALASNAPPAQVGLLEAVRQTLEHEPNIQIQERQVAVAKGAVQAAAGQFDLTLNSAASRGISRLPRTGMDLNLSGFTNVLEARTDVTSYRAGLSKQFRSGISVNPEVSVDRTADNLYQQVAVNRATVNFVLKVPLLRGRGREAVDAVEMAARVQHEAASLDLEFALAGRLLSTTTAYWNCQSAKQQLDILRATTQRTRELEARVKDLVRAGEMASAETNQVEADLAQQQANQVAGEQALLAARQNLGLALGLTGGQLAMAPLPALDFPPPAPLDQLPNFGAGGLVEPTLRRRADYQSALKAQRAAQILLVAARKNLKPQLDFSLEAGYSGLDEGSQFRRIYGALNPYSTTGPNILGTLSLEWPFANQTLRGLYQQRQAIWQQTQLRADDLARNVNSSVLVALSDLQNSRRQFERARESAAYFAHAVETEKEKLRLGNANIIDVLLTADRLATAQLNEISAHASYATALVRVRFELGLIVRPGADRQTVLSEEDLVGMPTAAELASTRAKP